MLLGFYYQQRHVECNREAAHTYMHDGYAASMKYIPGNEWGHILNFRQFYTMPCNQNRKLEYSLNCRQKLVSINTDARMKR